MPTGNVGNFVKFGDYRIHVLGPEKQFNFKVLLLLEESSLTLLSATAHILSRA